MRLVIVFILCSCWSNVVKSQKYQFVDNLSSIQFTIKNFGLSTDGSFKGLMGDIQFNTNDLSTSYFNANIEANSVHTGNESRDNHLKKEEYFDVSHFSKITLISKHIIKAGTPDSYTLIANVSIKGITKEIRFPFITKLQSDGILFNGEFTMNRRDFKVGGSSLVLADKLMVKLSVFAKKIYN